MRFIILIFALCALNLSGKIQAQEPFSQLDIRIEIAGTDERDLLSQIIKDVDHDLAAQGIRLKAVDLNTVEEIEHLLILWFSPSVVSSERHHLAINVKQVLLKVQPPIVEFSQQSLYERGLQLSLSDIDPKLASELISRAAVYSLGLCDTNTQNYFIDIIPQIEQSGENQPQNAQIIATLYFYAGNCAVQSHDFDGAIDLLQTGIVYESQSGIEAINPQSVANLAWVHLQTGQPETATALVQDYVTEIKELSSRGDQYMDMLYLSAQLHALAEDYDAAIDHLSRIIELFPYSDLYVMRAQMYLAQYEWDQSLADFNTAIELSPDYAEAYYQRGLLYYSILQTGTETRDEALADFQRYLELAPQGEHAADAVRYAESIQAQMEALEQ